MTEPTAIPAPAAPAAKPASFWEDLIDIFFQPADVFRRRERASFWPPLAVVAVLLAVFTIANANVLQPIIEGETARQLAQMMKSNPQFTPEMAERGKAFGEKIQQFIRYGTIVTVPVMAFLYGILIWLVSRLFAAKQSFNTTMVVVSYSFMPRVIESILFAVQGLIMDPANMNALSRIQLSAARFLDPDAANPLVLVLLSRLDLFVIWFWALVAVGLYVTGKLSREKAVAFAVTMWIIGTLPGLRNAYMRM
jgi:hypothetical protein